MPDCLDRFRSERAEQRVGTLGQYARDAAACSVGADRGVPQAGTLLVARALRLCLPRTFDRKLADTEVGVCLAVFTNVRAGLAITMRRRP